MATLDEVAAIALALPEVTESVRRGNREWAIGGRGFAWERPFSKADIKRFGDEVPPAGDILAVKTEDLHEKEAILEAGLPGFFTIPHFNGYPAVLIQLRSVRKRPLREAIVDAWLACAPGNLAHDYLANRRRR
jgi:hypothetical protein